MDSRLSLQPFNFTDPLFLKWSVSRDIYFLKDRTSEILQDHRTSNIACGSNEQHISEDRTSGDEGGGKVGSSVRWHLGGELGGAGLEYGLGDMMWFGEWEGLKQGVDEGDVSRKEDKSPISKLEIVTHVIRFNAGKTKRTSDDDPVRAIDQRIASSISDPNTSRARLCEEAETARRDKLESSMWEAARKYSRHSNSTSHATCTRSSRSLSCQHLDIAYTSRARDPSRYFNERLWKLMIKQIQTILLGLPEDIYAAVDSCETAQEIWLRVQQMMKGSILEFKRRRLSCLMNGKEKQNTFPEKIASNLKFLNNLQPEWSRHVLIVHQTKDLHTTDYTQLYDFLKYNQKEVDDQRAERLAKTHDPLALMANSNNPFNYPAFHQDQPSPSTYIQQPQPINNNYNPQPSFNQNFMQQPIPNPEDITDPTTAMNMALALMAKAFKLNYSTPTNNNQRISSNPRNRQIAQPGMNMGQDRQMQMVGANGGNQFRQYAGQNVGYQNGYNAVQNVGNQVVQDAVQNQGVQNIGNQNGQIGVQNIGNGNVVAARAEGNAPRNNGNQIRCYNCRGLGHLARNCTVRPRRRDAAYLQTQLLIAQKEEAGIQLQAEEFDLMAAQASTSGTQTDNAPVYDSDGSAERGNIHQEVHKILKYEIAPIVNQVDTRVINFEKQFLKEAAKFVGDFKSLAKEADESLDMNKVLEYENERLLREVLRAQLFGKFSKQNDAMKGTSANTKFAKPSTSGTKLYSVTPFQKTRFIPKVVKKHDLTKLVTSHSLPKTQESKVVKTEKVIAPGMFKINPTMHSRVDKVVPNKPVKASIRTKPITISQSHVFTMKDVNSNSNGLSSTGADNTAKTRRP
ncbi:retrovirus-related pol polyprotein from transposon TNT 1-94 [Tanacetum coccineum]